MDRQTLFYRNLPRVRCPGQVSNKDIEEKASKAEKRDAAEVIGKFEEIFKSKEKT